MNVYNKENRFVEKEMFKIMVIYFKFKDSEIK